MLELGQQRRLRQFDVKQQRRRWTELREGLRSGFGEKFFVMRETMWGVLRVVRGRGPHTALSRSALSGAERRAGTHNPRKISWHELATTSLRQTPPCGYGSRARDFVAPRDDEWRLWRALYLNPCSTASERIRDYASG